jgi:hypothetical protein
MSQPPPGHRVKEPTLSRVWVLHGQDQAQQRPRGT